MDLLVWFYNQRAGAENLIKEANNDAGLAAYPSARWPMNCNHFQMAMLAYNLNCWLMLFNREEKARAEDLKHTTLATSRPTLSCSSASGVPFAISVMRAPMALSSDTSPGDTPKSCTMTSCGRGRPAGRGARSKASRW